MTPSSLGVLFTRYLMSNVDLLEDHEAKSAHAQGWQLCHVFDAGNRTTCPQILPLAFTRPFDTSEKAARWVINRAQNGDKVAMKAINLVMKGLKK
mgnify:CR=1 FL=1